tara:strand:+ start:107 stop:766 length:660 start_codon:yes stop_codon:yes gene_type:complete
MDPNIYYKGDFTNPEYGLDYRGTPNPYNDPYLDVRTGNTPGPGSSPSDYNDFQSDFGNLLRQKYQEGAKLNPELSGVSGLVNAVTGAPVVFNNQDDKPVVTVGPGKFKLQGDNFGITLGSGIEGSYTSDDGKVNINAGLVPEGNNSYAANVNVDLGAIEEVPVPDKVLMDFSKVGGTNEYIPKKQEVVKDKSVGQQALEDFLEENFGITPLGGVGVRIN